MIIFAGVLIGSTGPRSFHTTVKYESQMYSEHRTSQIQTARHVQGRENRYSYMVGTRNGSFEQQSRTTKMISEGGIKKIHS